MHPALKRPFSKQYHLGSSPAGGCLLPIPRPCGSILATSRSAYTHLKYAGGPVEAQSLCKKGPRTYIPTICSPQNRTRYSSVVLIGLVGPHPPSSTARHTLPSALQSPAVRAGLLSIRYMYSLIFAWIQEAQLVPSMPITPSWLALREILVGSPSAAVIPCQSHRPPVRGRRSYNTPSMFASHNMNARTQVSPIGLPPLLLTVAVSVAHNFSTTSRLSLACIS